MVCGWHRADGADNCKTWREPSPHPNHQPRCSAGEHAPLRRAAPRCRLRTEPYEARAVDLCGRDDQRGPGRGGAPSDALRKDATPFTRGFFNSHPWGTPAQTIARATELANAFGTDELMFIFKYGAMPMAMAEKSMRLFAKEVMPALKELNPKPLVAEDRSSGPTVGSSKSAAAQ